MIAGQPDATFVHGVVEVHSAAAPESWMVSASGHKRKASAHHREATDRPVARQRGVQEDNGTLASLSGQIVRAVVASASSSEQIVELGDAAVSMNDRTRVRAEAKSAILHSDQPVPENGGGTMKLPIVIHDDEDDDDVSVPAIDLVLGEGDSSLPCPEPEPAQLAFEDNELTNPFGYSTWDPTDGGRYELLSTYLPPPCLDPDEEDAQRAAALRSSSLYLSPADIFWGTPDGVWTPY